VLELAIWGRAVLGGYSLEWANLWGANWQGAYLQVADLRWANLQGADLRRANLQEADLQKAILPDFQILPEEGAFIAWKKTTTGIVKLLIPEDALRVCSLVGRKCRTNKAQVLEGPGVGGFSPTQSTYLIRYNLGWVFSECNTDIRVECAKGIHFFLTRKEAEQW